MNLGLIIFLLFLILGTGVLVILSLSRSSRNIKKKNGQKVTKAKDDLRDTAIKMTPIEQEKKLIESQKKAIKAIDDLQDTWVNRDRKKKYSKSQELHILETLASNAEIRRELVQGIRKLEQRQKDREQELIEQERRIERTEAMYRYNKRMRTGTEERKLDSGKLWKHILELHITTIKRDLPPLSKKKQQYHRIGDYGEEIIDSRGWDMQLRYYIGAVLCNKSEWISPVDQDYSVSLDDHLQYFLEENLDDPVIEAYFKKYEMTERPPSSLPPAIEKPFNKVFWTCDELQRLIIEYLSNYYQNQPYTTAMIEVIERMIESYDKFISNNI